MLSGRRPCAREGGYAEEPSGACERSEERKGSTSYEMKKPDWSERRAPQNYKERGEGCGAVR